MTSGVPLREATRVWAHVGLNSFGGPAGQIAVMHREVVDDRRWISERRFLHALNYCMVLPGPEAQQLATYIGWLLNGVRGGVIAGSLFVLPGFVVMMLLAGTYAVFGEQLSGLFFGVAAAVVAIVAQAVVRLGGRTLRTRLLAVVAVAAFVALFFFAAPFPVVIVGAGVAGWAAGRWAQRWLPSEQHTAATATTALLDDDDPVPAGAARRALRAAAVCALLWLLPVAALVLTLGTDNIFTAQAVLFSKTAVVTFGGAYAVLAYVSQQAVQTYGWITADDMTAGLGLAETTPGPLIMVVQFVGFLAAYNNPGSLPPLVAGVLGAVVTVWVTFLPCFMFIFAGAPYVDRLRHNRALHDALSGIGAAVVGVIANLALWFALSTVFTVSTRTFGPLTVTVPEPGSLDPAAVGVAAVASLLVFGLRWPTMRVLVVCGGLGVLLGVLGLH